MEKKTIKKLQYFGFGFAVVLCNVPMTKKAGHWVLDINLDRLQKALLVALAHKPAPLTGAEIKFIRSYFELKTTQFGEKFGVTHGAVLKWEAYENDVAHTARTTEICMRLFILDGLNVNNGEFRKVYQETTRALTEQVKTPLSRPAPPLRFEVSKELRVG